MPRSLAPREAADYLLAYIDREAGETISLLKLQKLLYYAQGFCLALRGRPLYEEAVEAWENGPVVRSLHDAFRHHAYHAIPAPADFDPDAYLPEDRELLDAILRTYGQLSATKLRDLTHEEPPWREAFGGGGRHPRISDDAMASFFTSLVEDGRRGVSSDARRPAWPTVALRHQRRAEIGRQLEAHADRLRRVAKARNESSDPWGDDD